MPSESTILLAFLFSLGAHGIMTLNDFKAVEGDAQMGVRSLPVQMGVTKAAWTACAFMLGAQWLVVALLMQWGATQAAIAVLMLSFAQLPLMLKFIRQPIEKALSVSAFGVPLFVSGMMVSAWSLRGLEVAAS
jgi:chlorophyll synthase